MEQQQKARQSKEQILNAFEQLLADQKFVAPKIVTKQEAAEREEDNQIVEKASMYTVESIVKGLADLQLNFGNAVDSLVEKLSVEVPKLEELRRAILVETRRLEELRHIRVAADALDILIQEHQDTSKAFEEKSQQERQSLDRDIAEKRHAWQQEQAEFDVAATVRQELMKKERERDEADYQYELERKRKIDADDYTSRKAALERQIAEEEAIKEVEWSGRERVLAGQQKTLEKYKSLVASFPQELEEATQKAREGTMQTIYEEADVQADLFEKEREADREVSTLKIASLKETIEQQAKHIEHLSAQLQTALKQAQDLAVKAVEHPGQ